MSATPPISILLADDHAMVRDGLKALLEAQPDFKVAATVANGREAVAAAQRLGTDVAILDIAMPDLNGIDAARRLAEVAPRTRVLILSMHGSSEHIYRALRAGARGYLLKESAGKSLVAAVYAVHAGRRFLDSKIEETVIAEYLGDSRRGSPVDQLTTRERSLLQLLVEGHTNAQAAQALCLSVKTVETYRSRMLQKLGLTDLPGLVKFAIEHGLTGLK